MYRAILFLLLILSGYNYCQAQTDSTASRLPAAGQPSVDTVTAPHSPVKTLTYEQYDALMKGVDLYNMALPATLNNYPMPDEVIKHKLQLDLSPVQVTKITAIARELHRKRLEMGPIIIKNERTLDSLFRTHRVDDGTLIFYATRYGAYQGELRNAMLQACFATERLMSPAQVKLLAKLEGDK